MTKASDQKDKLFNSLNSTLLLSILEENQNLHYEKRKLIKEIQFLSHQNEQLQESIKIIQKEKKQTTGSNSV
ncbi:MULTISPECIES: hypothetical protein [Persicobacter]|uniref:Uncharacterized protein n=1 Tax=Persicobacter diffluens TaxID=981 RepID=A0AAN4VZ91_9BACT|nr:hypothetical protein [Persicobacter sp. CCB-QB2]GJM61801.1 hypothetical protein PEDI_23530 [Persicobacter diffluens]